MATRAVRVSKIAAKMLAKRPENPAAEEVPVRVEEAAVSEPAFSPLVTEKVVVVAFVKFAAAAVRPVDDAVIAPFATFKLFVLVVDALVVDA